MEKKGVSEKGTLGRRSLESTERMPFCDKGKARFGID
jgi:hypothetical protein